MKIENINNITVIMSEKGYFTNKDRNSIYANPIYLGKYDVPENYIEIDETEKQEIEAQLEKEAKTYRTYMEQEYNKEMENNV